MATSILTPPEFVAKWQRVRQTERATAQQHFLDVCHLLGQRPPAEADPRGDSFTFEKGVITVEGRRGFADVWKRGHFAWEYKGKDKDLGQAYRQLLQYREPLENPPLLIVCDIEHYEIHTNFTGTAKRVHRFTNSELTEPKPLEVLRAAFSEPERLHPETTVAQVTEAAAARFATLAEGLRKRGIAPRRAAHFLTQILFCLFAEDVGLLGQRVFTRVIERSAARPETFRRHVSALFLAMRDGGDFYLDEVPHFNGGLFAELDIVELTAEELRTLAEAAQLDWGTVEPAILGTLFERSLDPAKRAQLGAHYTGRDDVLRIIEPVLIAPLRREWAAVRDQLDTLRAVEAEPATTEHARRRQRQAQRAQQSLLKDMLVRFKQRLAAVRVLDPAAGSGNFLSVALTELLALEKEVVIYGALAGLPFMFPDVSPRQLYGLEVNAYAFELAQVSVWISYLQWLIANGFNYERQPVLQTLDTIRLTDAVLDRQGPVRHGRATWPAADVIVSNPPYLGGKRLRAELGDDYVDALFAAYDGQVPREADLVCYWYEQARAAVALGRAKRVGLLATNSIRGGASRRVLERINETGSIFMAWSDRPWVLDGAAVRISMVGFDDGTEQERRLDGQRVPRINPDLTAATDITVAKRLPENLGIAFMGDTKGGPFDIPGALARQWLALPENPNGRPNSDVVRPWVNGLDIARRPRDMWIIDFGTDRPEHEAALYEAPFEYVREHVSPMRATNNRAAYRERWWLHMEARSGMRAALADLPRFIGTARVATHRLFVWLDCDTLPDSQVITFARADDYFFGVLHSRAHEAWSLRAGTWLGVGNDPRYTPTTCFETFPFPRPDARQLGAISEAARALDTLRRNWLNPAEADAATMKLRTLTALYNARPTWLAQAHARLDRAVWAAYGWADADPSSVEEDVLLARLLALNLERARGNLAATSTDDHDRTAAD